MGVTMLIMSGSHEGSEVERMVAQARQAITLDTVDKALTVEAVDRVIVSTNSHALAEQLQDRPVCVELDAPGEEFHFGRQLLALIEKYEIEKLFYMGGGSGPLLSAEEIGHIAESLLSCLLYTSPSPRDS